MSSTRATTTITSRRPRATSSKPAGGGTFGGTNANAYGAAALTANTWSYLALTYDGATLRLYVNGTLVGSQAKTGAITTSTNQLQIGGDSLYCQYFSGLIDEVRVYNIALSAAAIQTDMNTPISASTDGTPPSAPGTLTASAVSANEIDLSWGAATDNVGVTGYQIFRCQNAGCTGYTLLAAPTGTATTYKDTSVAASTAYGYEVRATDAAGNLGPFSNGATATTPAPSDTTPPSAPGTLAAHTVSAGEIDLTWGAASDNVGVTGYEVFRCSGAACGSFAKVGSDGGRHDVVQRHRAERGDELQLRGAGTRRCRKHGAVLQHRLSDDVAVEFERPGRRLRLQRGDGNDGHRRVRERQRRHRHERHVGSGREVRRSALVQRDERTRRHPELGFAAADQRNDA